jgi:hypothetical protein
MAGLVDDAAVLASAFPVRRLGCLVFSERGLAVKICRHSAPQAFARSTALAKPPAMET